MRNRNTYKARIEARTNKLTRKENYRHVCQGGLAHTSTTMISRNVVPAFYEIYHSPKENALKKCRVVAMIDESSAVS